MSVIIVGNGPSILSLKRGNLIDSFETVIRINDYVIEGYEEYTGKKTDIWAMDTKCFDWRDRYCERWQDVKEIWVIPSFAYMGRYSPLIDIAKSLHNNVHFSDRVHALSVRLKVGDFPSTGINVIEFAFKKFQPPFTIVGFDACKTIDGKTDYWDEIAKPDNAHSHTKEALYIQGLIENGMVNRI